MTTQDTLSCVAEQILRSVPAGYAIQESLNSSLRLIYLQANHYLGMSVKKITQKTDRSIGEEICGSVTVAVQSNLIPFNLLRYISRCKLPWNYIFPL